MKVKMHEYKRQTQILFEDMRRNGDKYGNKVTAGNAEDMRRQASGIQPRRPPPSAPPQPRKSEKELKREASIMWWKEKEEPRGAGKDAYGNFMPWFHGLISRHEAEELLKPRYIGCFLVRVSENRFGYTLSYRVSNRCRHYMVEQDTHGRYALVGVEKVANSLNELIEWFQRNPINEDMDMLREPCGQKIGVDGYEECDYGELLAPGQIGYSGGGGGAPPLPPHGGGGGAAPPPVRRNTKPSAGGPPPIVDRGRKPSNAGAGGAPPPVFRGSKPR
jgi:hypothetical protein